jgi:hypothetical protein
MKPWRERGMKRAGGVSDSTAFLLIPSPAESVLFE